MSKVKGYKINMLHLIFGLRMGGAEIMVTHYIKALGKEKYNHYVYCFGNTGPVKEKLEALGVNVCVGKNIVSIKYPIRFTKSILLLVRDLLKFIKKKKIQIIQSHLRIANHIGIIMGKFSKIPAFPTIHNTMEFRYKRGFFDIRIVFIKLADEILYRIADRVLTVSNETKKVVRKKFRISDKKIIVVKNGIIFDGNGQRKKIDEKDLFSQNDVIKILAVGRLTYQKAMEVLVKATYNLIETGMKDFLVIIIGEGKKRKILENMIHKYKIEKFIELVGIRHDVIELMKKADIFIIPSRYEGLSIAMIEAMACGLPIIASDAPGIRPYIKHGANGLLFKKEDHNELSKNIIRLANNKKLRKKLSVEGQKYFNSEFNMNNNIISLVKLIDEYVSI